MALQPGTHLDRYDILAPVGRGGMGEVYLARDTRLVREVAIKIIPEALSQNPERLARFEREARLLASLNHPGIATVHGLEESDGVRFLVMEYIPGETLAERIVRGRIPVDEGLPLFQQIAESLEAAHEKGIVHRDLKPANIKITPEGKVKLLDFGLAKAFGPEATHADLSQSPTATREGTEAGVILGTPAYLSPEQARGKSVDKRTDIWAFGCCLFEALTGKAAFSGESVSDILVHILEREPDWEALPEATSPVVLRLLRRCLRKNLDQRPKDIGDLRLEIEDARRFPAEALHGGRGVIGSSRRRATTEGDIPRRGKLSERVRWAMALGGVGVLLVLLAGVIAMNVAGLREVILGTSGPEIQSLAVLPLKNLMADPGQDYFVDGMHEALITELSKISALKVISRTSAMRYQRTDKSIPQIARELGVTALIEGSVLREGDQVRVTVQLIHGPTDRHLWADSYQRELRGILALQSDVARAIAREIRITVTPAEATRLAHTRSVNPAAYEAYVLGRHHWNRRSINGYELAVEAFRKAVEHDPGYAPAYAGLADSYMLLGEQGGLSQMEARSLAEAAMQKALAADEGLAEAHSTRGQWELHYGWNWGAAEEAFQRAITLNPGDALAHGRYGRLLAFVGRFEEAIREVQRARELDPLSAIVNAYLGQVYLFAKRYDEAAEQFRRTLELNVNHALIRHSLGELYLAQGRFVEAIPELERSAELSGELSGVPSSHFLAMLGCAYARGNRREDAVKILNELNQRWQQGLVSAFDLASLYTAMGEKEQAVAWLEKGYEQRDVWFVELKAWPWFDSLRDDRRFQDLLRRMNLLA